MRERKSWIVWLGLMTGPPKWTPSAGVGPGVGLLLLIMSLLGAVILIATFWRLGEAVFLPDTDEKAELLRNLAFFLAALIGAPFVVWRAMIAQKQADLQEQGLFTDRFTKAVEQLGAEKTVKVSGEEQTEPNLEVRLGAIYALERLSKDSPDDHITIMETLCAYIRNNAPASTAVPIPDLDWSWGEDAKERYKENLNALDETIAKIPPVRIDIQAALTVIARRDDSLIARERDAGYTLDLANTNLQRADLPRAKLDQAVLRDCQLQEANLWQAQLQKAYLMGAQLQKAYLMGAQLQKAYLWEAQLQRVNLYEAQLQEAILGRAQLQKAYLAEAQLQEANLAEAQLQEADLWGAQLQKANLGGAVFNLTAVFETNFGESRYLTQNKVNAMLGAANTLLPSGIKRPADWPGTADVRECYALLRDARSKSNLP